MKKAREKPTPRPPDEIFWRRVAQASSAVLALDYDGTLAPFRNERMSATPLPGVIETIQSIIKGPGVTVAIISGRPVHELDLLVGGVSRSVLVVGSHGWEKRAPGMDLEVPPVPREVREALGQARRQAEAAVAELAPGVDPEGQVERKAASVGVHVRGLDKRIAGQILRRLGREWEAIPGGLELLEFNGGLELRARGRDKGWAVREILADRPGLDLAVYMGDDRTDEDAFAALPASGVGIKVGGPGAPTLARYLVADCEAALDFLRTWSETYSGTGDKKDE